METARKETRKRFSFETRWSNWAIKVLSPLLSPFSGRRIMKLERQMHTLAMARYYYGDKLVDGVEKGDIELIGGTLKAKTLRSKWEVWKNTRTLNAIEREMGKKERAQNFWYKIRDNEPVPELVAKYKARFPEDFAGAC